MYDYC
jgi:histone deacetylase 1/2